MVDQNNQDAASASRKLNILVLNQDWFVPELLQMGHNVVTAGWFRKDLNISLKKPGISLSQVFAELPTGFVPDRVVYHDDSGPMGIVDIENSPIPTVFYSVDAHHHWFWHDHFGGIFDCVLVAQNAYVHKFTPYNQNARWFPLYAPIH